MGGVPLIQHQKEATTDANALEDNCASTADFSFVEGDAVDMLERKINRTYDAIKRIVQENESLDAEVQHLEEINQKMRQEIASVPMGKNPTRKGVDQLCKLEKKLIKKIRELDRQVKLLKRRRKEIEQTKRKIRSEDGQEDAKSYSTQTSKSISTFVDNDEDEEDEDIVVFSTEKDGDSDSNSEIELSSSEEDTEEIVEEIIDEEADEVSLGSFNAEEELLECKESSLGDSLKDLPYEPAISLL